MTHELKCLAIYFEELWVGNKTFELRFKDRDFKVGDILRIREWRGTSAETMAYTTREISAEITYMTDFSAALKPGWVCLAIKEIGRKK